MQIPPFAFSPDKSAGRAFFRLSLWFPWALLIGGGASAQVADGTAAATPPIVRPFHDLCGTVCTVAVPPSVGSREVAAANQGPARAGAVPTSRTFGPKRVLVLRVDFSDVPGAAVSQAEAQAVMDDQVRPFFEAASYGATTLVTTVAPQVYRMTRTASQYALTVFSELQMMTEAKNAAATAFPAGNYDRIIVVHPYIGPSRITGSYFTYAGLAIQGSDEIWINGTFSAAVVAHELGHTFGLGHANLWQVSDGNPVSIAGRPLEYGDPFDVMGTGWNDGKADLNPWEKSWIGWLPDTAVTSITASGTYRVYRYDQRNALGLNQPLALRIPRGGAQSYWLSMRQGLLTNAELSNGAQVHWGYDAYHATELLDLNTPGSNPNDAALGVGRTFTDSYYGISFKTVARGGSGAAQYLDIEIVIPPAPQDSVRGWHTEGGTAFVPPGLSGLRALTANDSYIVGLKQDGTLMGWWFNGPLLDIPPIFTNAVSVAAGAGVVGTVRADGTVQFWSPQSSGPTPPAGLTGIRQLALGAFHGLALRNDGTVLAWGGNDSGEATVPPGLTDVVSIAAGSRFSAALKADGTVVRWGQTRPNDIPLPSDLKGVIAIATNTAGQHLVLLKADGTVVVTGANVLRQANVPPGLNNVVAIAAGSSHSLALRADGTVVIWGSNAGFVPAGLGRAYGFAANSQANFVLTGTGAFITGQPVAQSVPTGQPITLNVGVSALATVSYQWRKNGQPIAGATSSTYTVSSTFPGDSGSYDVIVSSRANTVISFPARIAVVSPLIVVRQPEGQAVELGGSFTLSVAATGAGAVTYQWRKDNRPLPGATGAALFVSRATRSDTGSYDVMIADGVSAAVSGAAEISTFATARISNLSIRSRAGPRSQPLVVGFVVGSGDANNAKAVLLRGAGPALVPFGVTDVLPDPRIELYRGPLRLAENDDWAGDAIVAARSAAVGAFAFGNPMSPDAALYRELESAGPYTLQVSGEDASSGAVLAEIYDATADESFGLQTRRLVNVSARADVGNGGSPLIAGFTISGRNGKRVLIRAIGPTLATFGVAGSLPDPKLELYDGAGRKLAENDTWGSTLALVSAAENVGAFALPSDSKDAAILLTLPAGNYSAHVTDVSNRAGVALVEIYEAP